VIVRFVHIGGIFNHLGLNFLFLYCNTTDDVGNPGPGLGQAQKCGRVKPVNEIPTLPS
jgi:hypothetical protein